MAETAKERQTRKKAGNPEPKQQPDVFRVDFNRIIRNLEGKPYRTAQDRCLRLGRAVIDALEQVSANEQGRPVDRDEKLRRDKLAGAIINESWERVEDAAPYRVLMLPERVVAMLDGVLGQAYAPGLFGAAHRLLRGTQRDSTDFGFEGVEVVSAPSLDETEAEDAAESDYTPDPEQDAEDGDAEAEDQAAGPETDAVA